MFLLVQYDDAKLDRKKTAAMRTPCETILTALHARLSALPATVRRNEVLPEKVFEQRTCWVIGFQKKPDPPAALPSDRRALLVTGCTREQNLGLAGTGRYFGPTLVIPKVGIFSALETDT